MGKGTYMAGMLKLSFCGVMVPFILLAKTGFTNDLARMCTSLSVQGMNFLSIETLILERRMDTFSRQQEIYKLHMKMIGRDTCTSTFKMSLLSNSQSNDIISNVFLAQFLNDEHLYLRHINSIQTGTSISFDHTFKVAPDIRYCREDVTWVPQYDRLFIVMNNEGKVQTWQLTKGTSFSHIEVLLSDLKEQSPNIETVYIDDCCKLRAKISSLLGDNVLICFMQCRKLHEHYTKDTSWHISVQRT